MTAKTNRKVKRSGRRGAAAVEFALTAPIVIVLMFACVEFSRLNMLRNSAGNAAYEGCRRGVVPGATAAQAKTMCEQVLQASNINSFTVTVSPSNIVSTTETVTVTANVTLAANSWIPAMFLPSANVVRSCALSREQVERRLKAQ